MRITFVCAIADLSGGFRVIATYAKLLRERGHEVLVVSRPPRKPTVREWLRALNEGPAHLPMMPRQPGRTTWTAPASSTRCWSATASSGASDLPDADVVLATWWETAEWVEMLPPEKGVQVHFIQDYELWGGPKERVDATCRLPMPKITPAKWVKTLLAEQFGQTDVTLRAQRGRPEHVHRPAARQAVDPDGRIHVYAFPAKGLRRHDRSDPPRPPAAAGAEGGGVRAVQRRRAEMPLPKGTEFHHRAPEAKLKDLYGKCDAWLFGTRKEGFGLPILEAMACRTPVIGTPAGAAPELLEGGGGILVPMEDPQAMADAILKVCAMHASRLAYDVGRRPRDREPVYLGRRDRPVRGRPQARRRNRRREPTRAIAV